MDGILLKSTAAKVVGRGYLSSDHISTATGLDPAFMISKNGGAFANPAAGASVMTEIEATGWYYFALGTADVDTLGPLIIRGTHATMDNIEVVYQVVETVTAANATQWLGQTIHAATVNGVPVVQLHDSAGAGGINAPANFEDLSIVDTTGLVAVPTTQKVDVETIKTQTVTCAAGVTVLASVGTAATSTAQTGDSYAIVNGDHGLVSIQDDIDAILLDTAEIGTAGAGLTAVPWNATWDAQVQSEVADALDFAIPATPTADSINDYIVRTKCIVVNKMVLDEATGDVVFYKDNDTDAHATVAAAFTSDPTTTTKKRLE